MSLRLFRCSSLFHIPFSVPAAIADCVSFPSAGLYRLPSSSCQAPALSPRKPASSNTLLSCPMGPLDSAVILFQYLSMASLPCLALTPAKSLTHSTACLTLGLACSLPARTRENSLIDLVRNPASMAILASISSLSYCSRLTPEMAVPYML